MIRLSTLFFAALLLPLAAPAAAQERAHDKLTDVSASDAAMEAAKARGRAELPGFFARFAAPGADETYFVVKYNLTPDRKAEFIWAEVISHKDGVTVAELANNPLDPRFSKGQRVNVRDADIVDWGYFKGSVMQGNYTSRALLPHMSPAEAASMKSAYGW